MISQGMFRSRIQSVSSYVPPRLVTNQELSERMDTSDEWIFQRTGIKQRYWVDESVNTSDLAYQASIQAIDQAGIQKKDLDMIFLATLSPDHEFPGTACFLQAKLDLPGIPAVDVRQQCTGFLYGMSMADQYIRTGSAKNILVVGSEVHSKGLDLSTEGRDVAVLFGDGAGAVVMSATDQINPKKDSFVLSTHLHADGAFAKELWVQAPGSSYLKARLPLEAIQAGEHYPEMNGKMVFSHAVRRMPEALKECLDANQYRLEDVDLFIFHQANLRIIEMIGKQLQIPEYKVFNTIDRFANTTSATIPIGLDEAVKAGKLKKGMLVATTAFGSGFTWASSLIRW